MNIILKDTISEIDTEDTACLEHLANNLDLCRNEHTLACKNCVYNNVGDYCIPSLSQHLLKMIKGENKNDN